MSANSATDEGVSARNTEPLILIDYLELTISAIPFHSTEINRLDCFYCLFSTQKIPVSFLIVAVAAANLPEKPTVRRTLPVQTSYKLLGLGRVWYVR
jgi:hypothetical protein